MDFVALMFNGDDMFTLEATAALQSLYVDLGEDDDTFVNNPGTPFPFPVTLVNL